MTIEARVKPDADRKGGQRRNKNYDDTHREMIETAVRLISEIGVEAVSIAALARAMNINRTTVYYHFDSRDELIAAVKVWSAQQLARAFRADRPQRERIDYITRFVLENPELIKLWFEDLLTEGDIRDSYPHWDALVDGVAKSTVAEGEEPIDAEIYSILMLTSAILGPRVFKNRVRPDLDDDTIVERFHTERRRMLKAVSLLVD